MPEDSKEIHALELTMARIEGKLDAALELKTDVTKLRDDLARTDDTARSAEAKADTNRRDIDALKANQRWAIGIMAPILVTIVIFILGILLR
ncbi:hemolysin XhlA family protein [Psychrobacillus sp. OK032]|uniref:hemolysin XhlA family protein n=1 Tax=Psychrobacillus sp. OK032 TaxID=1884358 RepID=UPI0008BC095A|nr:hemolysin XhlA family protein [Psychrobacillus sp. OK032]SER87104.1 Haemolysin XhlA [Psychrobacillus sp. OK032]